MAKHIGDVSLAHSMCTRKRMQKVECIYRSVGRKSTSRRWMGWRPEDMANKMSKTYFCAVPVTRFNETLFSSLAPDFHWRCFRHAINFHYIAHSDSDSVSVVCLYILSGFFSLFYKYIQTNTHTIRFYNSYALNSITSRQSNRATYVFVGLHLHSAWRFQIGAFNVAHDTTNIERNKKLYIHKMQREKKTRINCIPRTFCSVHFCSCTIQMQLPFDKTYSIPTFALLFFTHHFFPLTSLWLYIWFHIWTIYVTISTWCAKCFIYWLFCFIHRCTTFFHSFPTPLRINRLGTGQKKKEVP